MGVSYDGHSTRRDAGRRSRTREARSDWVAPVHMNAAMTASQSASNTWTWLPDQPTR